jgi:hypothetical protein
MGRPMTHKSIHEMLSDPKIVLRALRRAREAAARRHALAGQPLLDWHDGRIIETEAVITQTRDKKSKSGGGDMGDMDY